MFSVVFGGASAGMFGGPDLGGNQASRFKLGLQRQLKSRSFRPALAASQAMLQTALGADRKA
eukprot:2280043-Lingulodinium_polyedra.AAC.1